MSHLAWVMFWKAIVVVVWAIIAERYWTYKKRRKEAGLKLRFDKRSNAYVVDDRLERWERRAKIAMYCALGLLIPYTAFVVYVLIAS